MSKSLLDQYPHLKSLLNENKDKNSVANRIRDARSSSVLHPLSTNSQSVNRNNDSSLIRTKSSSHISNDTITKTDGIDTSPKDVSSPIRPTTANLAVLKGKPSILGPGVGVKKSANSQMPTSSAIKPISKPLRKVTAEELFAESVASDNDQWLSFQIESIPAIKQIDQLKMWLATNKPSEVDRSAGIGWIAVKMTGREGKNLAAKEDWDNLADSDISMETVNIIAGKHGVTGGKWLCHVSRDNVDKTWYKLAIALFSGGLGPNVYMIKVSPAVEDGGRCEHVICVYTPDYRDINQVMRVENLMRSAGVVNDLLYKPDIFSTLGIYRANKWGFKATIYSSKIMLVEGKSKISVAGSDKTYYNSNKGFENTDSFDFDQVTAMISSSITKPTPRYEPPPTQAHIADQVLVDIIEKFKTDEEETKDDKEENNNDKSSDLTDKLSKLGFMDMDQMSKVKS